MTAVDRRRRVALACAPGIGPVTYRRLWSRLGAELEPALAEPERLAAQLRLDARALAGLRTVGEPAALEAAAGWLADLEARGGCALLLGEEGFPARLAGLRDAPAVLFLLGRPDLLSAPRSLAIVGSRRAHAPSLDRARGLAAAAAARGIAVISGLALGVDGAAHLGALAAGGPTAAVLGGGPELPFPPEHADLHAALAAAGAVVAAEPPGTPTVSRRLVRRNRWIAALADAVVVVEAGSGSGARHAAAAARDYARRLFAVRPPEPGDRFAGNAQLLATGGARALDPALEPAAWLEEIA